MRKHRQNWLDIFYGFRVALDIRKMVLGMVGVFITALALVLIVGLATFVWPSAGDKAELALRLPGVHLHDTATLVWNKYTEALAHPFRLEKGKPGLAEFCFANGTIFILLAIWSYIGGAICRLAAVDFARDERLSMADGCGFACRKFGSLFWSPLIPLMFIVILLACNALLGLVGRIPAAGPVFIGLGYWLAAISSFIVLLLAIGGGFGLAFMWPTIAMEGTDTFDAVSRSFAYLYSRPWKTLWCWLVSAVYGAVCIFFVGTFTCWLLLLTRASVDFGVGGGADSIVKSMRLLTDTLGPDASVGAKIGVTLVRFVFVIAWGLALGFVVSYKCTAMTIVYAVIRRDVDGTDMGEVFLPEPEETEAPAAEETKSEEPAQESPAEESKPDEV